MIIQSSVLWKDGVFTPGCPISLNCELMGQSLRRAWIVASGCCGSTRFELSLEEPPADKYSLTGILVTYKGAQLLLDAQSVEAIVEACDGCCGATPQVPGVYNGVMPPAPVPGDLVEYTVLRVDDNSFTALGQAMQDYYGQYSLLYPLYRASYDPVTGVSTYKFWASGPVHSVGNDQIEGGSNVPPTVNAGADQELAAGVTSANLSGTATPGAGSAITSTLWTVEQAPAGNTPIITDPTSLTTTVTGMVAGTYVFRLTAQADNGTSAHDDTQVKIQVAAQLIDGGAYSGAMHALIYYPEGDDDHQVARPLLVYLHPDLANGINNGDDVWALTANEDSGLPYFVNLGMKVGYRVIFPQRHDGLWTADNEAYAALQWAKTQMAVDLTRIYLGGPSSGGGGVNKLVVDHPLEFAHSQSAAPVFSTAAANPAAFQEVMLELYHGMQDSAVPVDSSGSTVETDNAINALGTPVRYSPAVNIVFDEVHSPSMWNDYLWNTARAPFNFYERQLLFSTDPVVTATNFVNRAAATETFQDWAQAAWKVDRLPAGASKTALQAQLAGLRPSNTYFINLGSTENSFTAFTLNNAPSPANGATVANLSNIGGTSSALGFVTVTNGGVPYTAGMTAALFGLSSLVVSTGFPITQTTSVYKITGIPTGKFVDIFVYYSDRSLDKTNITGFWIDANGAAQGTTRQGPWNSFYTVDLLNVPEVGGEVTLNATALTSAGGTIIGIAFQVKDLGAPLLISRWSFRETAAGVPAGWNAFITEPSSGIRTLTDAATSIALSTVSTGADWWQNFAFTFYHSDTEGPDVPGYPSWMPAMVGRGALFNYNTQFKRPVQNYNLQFTKPGGLPSGLWRMRVFGSTSNGANNSNAHYIGKIGDAGINKQRMNALNNTTRWLEFIGRITPELQDMKLAAHIGPVEGLVFINAITLEQLSE